MSWLRLMEERIKQEHEHPHKNGGDPTHKRKNRVMALVAEMWPAYLIEIFVIILGIWVSLGLEQWRDNAREDKLEKVYEKNLLTDINTDLVSLKDCERNTANLLMGGRELAKFVASPSANKLSPDKATNDLQMVLGRPKFLTSDATFSDLKSSGNLHLLKNIHLKNLLFSYYSTAQGIKEMQDAEQQATITVTGPYFFKHFDLSSTGKPISQQELQTLLNDREFSNNLQLRIHNREELAHGYLRAGSLAKEIRKELGGPADDYPE
ncbi:MAG: hypothetical protein JST32_02800 [Bacteroidetes bacterium]|nr:hypothetical protein [Bacteroidota bacterium]